MTSLLSRDQRRCGQKPWHHAGWTSASAYRVSRQLSFNVVLRFPDIGTFLLPSSRVPIMSSPPSRLFGPTRTRTRVASIVVLIAFIAVACSARLTPDGAPYLVTVKGSTTTFTNAQSGANNREALWSSTQTDMVNSTQCARWVSGKGHAQNGLAFRIKANSGGWDAVVLERNILYNGFWSFVVIYFHSGTNQRTRWDVGPAADLGDYLGRDLSRAVFPLSICARLTGSTLQFAVAKGSDAMPALGTSGRGATLRLDPRRYPASGITGTYIAHIPAGTSAVVDRITINGRPSAPVNS
jgi:hypothetical protein